MPTIIRSNPDYKWEGLQELGIEGDERISYIRFQYRNNNDDEYEGRVTIVPKNTP